MESVDLRSIIVCKVKYEINGQIKEEVIGNVKDYMEGSLTIVFTKKLFKKQCVQVR